MENIQAESLRIGNYAKVNNPKHHLKLKDVALEVVGISPSAWKGENTHSISLEYINPEDNKYYESFNQFIKYIEPIPLTEQWLKDFGFDYDQDNSDNYYDIQITKELFLSINLDTHNALIGKGYDWTNAIAKVRHLHQLQNLYFALTSMELTKQ